MFDQHLLSMCLLVPCPCRCPVPSAPWRATVLSPPMSAAQQTTAPTCSAAACAAPPPLPSEDVRAAAWRAQQHTSCSASTLSTSTRGGHWGWAPTTTRRQLGWGFACSRQRPSMTGRRMSKALTAVWHFTWTLASSRNRGAPSSRIAGIQCSTRTFFLMRCPRQKWRLWPWR